MVIGMMTKRHAAAAFLPGDPRQEVVARAPRRRLNACAPGPGQLRHIDLMQRMRQAPARSQPTHEVQVGLARFAAQAVIKRRDVQVKGERAAQADENMKQRHRIAAAGHRHHQLARAADGCALF